MAKRAFMQPFPDRPSRRAFLHQLGMTTAWLSIASCAPSTMALESSQLPLRQQAIPLWLHYNENSLGMAKSALQAAQLATQTIGNRYPDETVDQLRLQLAKHHDIAPEMIVFGNGSTEVIQGIVTLAAKLKAKVLEPTPTFGDVRRYSKAEGLEVISVPVGAGFMTDVAALQSRSKIIKGPLLINLCNPNNPTGSSVEWAVLEDWISNAPEHHLFLIDEAYFDYAQANPKYQSALSLILKGMHNVVITRTFSKIYGMAGMRVGYGIATTETAAKIRPFAAGYNLTAAGIAAASASLNDAEFYATSIKSNAEAKQILTSTLDELQLQYIPSDTNFVLHRINASLGEYSQRMRQNGIYVGRKMTVEDNWNRISLGTPEEMRQFTAALHAFRQRGWV